MSPSRSNALFWVMPSFSRPAGHGGPRCEARADGHVAVTAHEGGDERQQCVEAGGEVDVHVGDDGGVVVVPGGAQRTAAALLVEVDGPHAVQREGERAGDLPRGVGGGVVGDRDLPVGKIHELFHRRVKSPNRGREGPGFIEDRKNDVESKC